MAAALDRKHRVLDDDDDNDPPRRYKLSPESTVVLSAPTYVHFVDPSVITIAYGEDSNPRVKTIVDTFIANSVFTDKQQDITLALGIQLYTLTISWVENKDTKRYDVSLALGAQKREAVIVMTYDPTRSTHLDIGGFYWDVDATDRIAMKDKQTESWGGYGARGMFFVKWVATSLGVLVVDLKDLWCGHGTVVFNSEQMKTLVDVMRWLHDQEYENAKTEALFLDVPEFYENIYEDLVVTTTIDAVLEYGWLAKYGMRPLRDTPTIMSIPVVPPTNARRHNLDQGTFIATRWSHDLMRNAYICESSRIDIDSSTYTEQLPFEYTSRDLSTIMRAIRDGKSPPSVYVLAPDRFQKEYQRLKNNGKLNAVILDGYYAQFGFERPNYHTSEMSAKNITNTKSRF
jgi:hypothetical protein